MLFLGLNYAPEEIGIGLYSGDLLRCWAQAGNEADAVVAHPYYPQWRVWPGYGGGWRQSEEDGVRVVRCPLYVPANPTGGRRILHHLSFGASSFLPMIWKALRRRPALVMTTAPSLIAAPVALLSAKICGGCSWLHVQDFEVEAAFATGLVRGKGVFAQAARSFERWILRSFDVVSSISPQMCDRLRAKGVAPDRIFELRNWADVDGVVPLAGPSPYRAEWAIETPHVALYSGNIAYKQGIGLVLDAARLLGHREDLTFVICGEGPTRAKLERDAAQLPNVRIFDLQPKARLGELLGLASVHLLPQLAGAADLLLPSKLTNMLASGRPVVGTADPGTGLAEELEGVGLVTPPGDAVAFAAAIERLIDDQGEARRLGAAARARAEERWSRTRIIDRSIARACAVGSRGGQHNSGNRA